MRSWGPLLFFLALALGGGLFFLVRARSGTPIVQPIAFSHLLHVKNPNNPRIRMDCGYCHENYKKGRVAGIPSITTCMPCHSVIKSDSTEVRKLKEYYSKGQEIPWVRLNKLPYHNVFSHQWHVKAGIECSHCHGDVGSSSVTEPMQEFTMEYCYSCHVSHQASVDCMVCHK